MPPMQVQGIAQLCTPHRVLCQFVIHSPRTLQKERFYILSVDNAYLFLPVFLWCAQGKDGFKIFLDFLHLCREAIGNHYIASSGLLRTFWVPRFISALLPAYLQLWESSHLTFTHLQGRHLHASSFSPSPPYSHRKEISPPREWLIWLISNSCLMVR